jgi:hypothetical protein
VRGKSVCPGGCAGLSQGWLGEYRMMLDAHLFGMLNVSHAGLESASGGTGALLFSQCNVVWSLEWAMGSECWSFDSSWCFISNKCDSRVSARFLIYRAHAVCFHALVAILDPLQFHFLTIFLIIMYIQENGQIKCLVHFWHLINKCYMFPFYFCLL